MGAFSLPGGLFGSPGGSSQQVIPGLLSRKEARPYIFEAADLLNSPLPYGSMDYFNNLLTNPNFAPQSQAEQNLVNQLFAGRQSQFNNLGIGDSPAAQTSIAASAAPALLGFRQNQISNFGDFLKLLLGQRQQQLTGLGGLADYGKVQGQLTTSTGQAPGALGLFNQTFGQGGAFGSGGKFGGSMSSNPMIPDGGLSAGTSSALPFSIGSLLVPPV